MSEWKTLGEEGMFAEVLRVAETASRTCVRCGTEWRPDYADQSLTDTPNGPVCASRWNCDHRVKLRETLAAVEKR